MNRIETLHFALASSGYQSCCESYDLVGDRDAANQVLQLHKSSSPPAGGRALFLQAVGPTAAS